MTHTESNAHSARAGQSIAEVLVAIAIGILLVGAAGALIIPSLKSNTQAAAVQAGTTIANGLLSNVRVWSQGNWDSLLALATGTANTYYLNTSSTPFTVATGTQSIVVGTTTYTDYFYLMDAYRSATGTIVSSGGSYDPSTKQVVVGYAWPHSATLTVMMYLTRNQNAVVDQTDWSGGAGQNGPMTSTNSQFTTSSDIDYSTTTGSFYLAIPGY